MNDKPAMIIKPTQMAYSLSMLECDYVNSDIFRDQPTEHQAWWNDNELTSIITDCKTTNEEWKKAMLYDFCDYSACIIAEEEGEENVPERDALATAIKDLIIANF